MQALGLELALRSRESSQYWFRKDFVPAHAVCCPPPLIVKNHMTAIWVISAGTESSSLGPRKKSKQNLLIVTKFKSEALKHQAPKHIHFPSHSMSLWTIHMYQRNKAIFHVFKNLKITWFHSGLQNVFLVNSIEEESKFQIGHTDWLIFLKSARHILSESNRNFQFPLHRVSMYKDQSNSGKFYNRGLKKKSFQMHYMVFLSRNLFETERIFRWGFLALIRAINFWKVFAFHKCCVS